jgi:Na+/H+ antiporter NhaD/arsenite permease-like protein
MVSEPLIALLIFVVIYVLLATEYKEATIAALAGAGAMWAFGVLTPREMIGYIDLNAIGLLFGMMVIVGALTEAHFFQWVGISVSNLCRCRPDYLLVAFTVLTGALSSILPNVTIILFMVAITLEIAELLKLDPKPYIISEILASNIGGVATLIGDPPNIMIATEAGFTFLDFLTNVGLIALLSLFVSLAYVWFKFKDHLMLTSDTARTTQPTTLLKVPDMSGHGRLLWTGLAALAGSLVLFSLQNVVGIYPTTVALLAAVLLLFAGGPKMPDILRNVEWSTLMFFGSIFIIVGGLEKTGWMYSAAQVILAFVGHDLSLGLSVALWLISLISSLIMNIPFAAAFIPVLKDMGNKSGFNVYPFWWALAAGTGMGGNGTAIGASSNVIAIGIAKAKGVRITFLEFAKVGMVVLVLTTLVANLIILAQLWT